MKMAARARTLVQRWWREGDGFDRYMMVGGATGVVTGLVVGVAAVLDNQRASRWVARRPLSGQWRSCGECCTSPSSRWSRRPRARNGDTTSRLN